jgi:hypothetical protein
MVLKMSINFGRMIPLYVKKLPMQAKSFGVSLMVFSLLKAL